MLKNLIAPAAFFALVVVGWWYVFGNPNPRGMVFAWAMALWVFLADARRRAG